jgi:hypothetical protein
MSQHAQTCFNPLSAFFPAYVDKLLNAPRICTGYFLRYLLPTGDKHEDKIKYQSYLMKLNSRKFVGWVYVYKNGSTDWILYVMLKRVRQQITLLLKVIIRLHVSTID